MEESKSAIKSKTVWMGVLTAASAFFPPVQAFIVANPEIASSIVGGVFTILRFFSNKKVEIKKK